MEVNDLLFHQMLGLGEGQRNQGGWRVAVTPAGVAIPWGIDGLGSAVFFLRCYFFILTAFDGLCFVECCRR